MTCHHDLIVIGAGPGGYELAAAVAACGLDVAIVERDAPGGTCLNRGCIPTKCLCAAADAALSATNPAPGVFARDMFMDFGAVRAHMQQTVDSLRDDIATALKSCTYYHAQASLTADGAVQLSSGQLLTATHVVIATGSTPAILPIDGADLAIDSDRALALDAVPASMAVIGGGVIGLEMASAFSALGCKVTVVEFLPEILPGFDADIARRLRSMLSRRGIKIITSAAATAIAPAGDASGAYTLCYTAKGKPQTLTADKILMAVGRRPVLPEGVESCGIAVDNRGFITVDELMRTSRPGVYAIGDVADRGPMLAHVASAQARLVAAQICSHSLQGIASDSASIPDIDFGTIPSVVFTNPGAYATGLTQAAAESAGYKVTVRKTPVISNGYARATAHTDGLVKVITDADSGRVLGIHYVGPQAPALVAQAQLIVSHRLTAAALSRTIFPHPTLTELLAL